MKEDYSNVKTKFMITRIIISNIKSSEHEDFIFIL